MNDYYKYHLNEYAVLPFLIKSYLRYVYKIYLECIYEQSIDGVNGTKCPRKQGSREYLVAGIQITCHCSQMIK